MPCYLGYLQLVQLVLQLLLPILYVSVYAHRTRHGPNALNLTQSLPRLVNLDASFHPPQRPVMPFRFNSALPLNKPPHHIRRGPQRPIVLPTQFLRASIFSALRGSHAISMMTPGIMGTPS